MMLRRLHVLLLASLLSGCDLCGNKTIKSVTSPDHAFKAVLFERDCGAKTDFSSQVSVLQIGTPLSNDSGNTFIADPKHGTAKPAPWGGPVVQLRWLKPRRLQVTLDRRARTFKAERTVGGIQITYVRE